MAILLIEYEVEAGRARAARAVAGLSAALCLLEKSRGCLSSRTSSSNFRKVANSFAEPLNSILILPIFAFCREVASNSVARYPARSRVRATNRAVVAFRSFLCSEKAA